MKLMKRLLASLFFWPGLAVAHPGHEHEGLDGFTVHVLNGTEPHFILLGLALLSIVAIWFVKGR